MNEVVDINDKRFTRKLKRFWTKNQDTIIYVATMTAIGATSIGLMVYLGKVAKQMKYTALPTVINEGPKSTYQLGGANSPLKYELTDAMAAAYNRAGDAVANAKKTLNGGWAIKAEKSDMAAWNYVASMTNDFIKQYGSIDSSLVTNHYLTKI